MAYNVSKKAPKVKLSHYKGYTLHTDARRSGTYKDSSWHWWWEIKGLYIGEGKFKTLASAKKAIDRHLRFKKMGLY